MFALTVYMLFGLALAWEELPSLRGPVKCWLGLVFGCTALMWLPCIAAFFWGFTQTAQDRALGFAAAMFIATAVVRRKKIKAALAAPKKFPLSAGDIAGLALSLAATAFCAYLLHTHVLYPAEDGSLWVGQSTYGDLAMHLGFVESLYRQGTFPPEYSIYPGQQLNYPFLVDAASASLRFFGLSLRMSVIVPSVVMLFCVFWGFWLLAEKIIQKTAPTAMAWLMLVSNGGFGFFYFLGKYDFSDIFTGYYTTPTNLVGEDIRWVNVICDMLIPQRTTMAGWCVLLAAMFLLVTAVEKAVSGDGRGSRRTFFVLAVLAGALPMVHTHSFLALGILSAVWFFCALPPARRSGTAAALVKGYVLYGAVCLALAVPQFLKWTMDAVQTGNLLRWNLGWVAGANGALNNWLWFFIVNCGVVFLLMWFMLPFLRGEKLGLFLGAAAIFVISNLAAFQPNLYDNNKLLYVWFMITDILVCDWLWQLLEKLRRPAARGIIACVVVFFGTFSGLLSMAREAVSKYQLLSASQVDAAEFIVESTEPDSVFLTATSHTNPVCVLAGRNIVCGSSLYLYYHGVDYAEREAQVKRMFESGEDFELYAAELGVDYVYIGGNEYANYDVDYDYFAENYALIYEADGISIFQID